MGLKRCIHCFNGNGKTTLGETCLACAGMGTVWTPDPKKPTTKSTSSSSSNSSGDTGSAIFAVIIIFVLIGVFAGGGA